MDDIKLKPARPRDAIHIARMSRDLIEKGLGWSWRPKRVANQIKRSDTMALVARTNVHGLVGFAIMRYDTDEAHLLLLAVSPTHRRLGLGRQMLQWHDACARTAGIHTIHLEVRARNKAARAFYRDNGFYEVERVPGYYQGRESAMRMSRQLRPRGPVIMP